MKDTIYRQEAIDALCDNCNFDGIDDDGRS